MSHFLVVRFQEWVFVEQEQHLLEVRPLLLGWQRLRSLDVHLALAKQGPPFLGERVPVLAPAFPSRLSAQAEDCAEFVPSLQCPLHTEATRGCHRVAVDTVPKTWPLSDFGNQPLVEEVARFHGLCD